MSEDSVKTSDRLNGFLDACRRAGIRATHQRIAIFQAVADNEDHPDAETVYEAVRRTLPTVSLDTVYRTLWLLKDMNIISTLGSPRERTRFDANTHRHHHFVCSECGLAKDFYCQDFDELPVPDALNAVGKVESTHVELRGLCSNCRMLCEEGNSKAGKRQGGKR